MAERARIDVTLICRWCGGRVTPATRMPKTGKPLEWVHDIGGYRQCFLNLDGGTTRRAEPTFWRKAGES